jgi:penicillin-binding protein 2
MGWFSRERRWRSQPRRMHSEEDASRTSGRRLIVIRLVVMLLFCALSLQLLRFQVWSGGRYQLKAESNRLRLVTVPAPRGLMYDRNHNPLVRNVASYTAVIVPADLPKGQENDIYYQLSSVIGVPPDQIEQKVADSLKRNDPFTPVAIKEQLDQNTVLTLAELRHTLPGVDIRYDTVRQYNDPVLMSHIYGYVGPINPDNLSDYEARGYQQDDKVGQTGLEYTYEDQLRGTPGKQQVEVDASGRQLRQLGEIPPKPGNSLVLSIDLDLQQHITDILQRSLNETGSDLGVAIMMDVHTGEILAYVSLPNYDVSKFATGISQKDFDALLNAPGKPLTDHAIQDAYPPGSTFKVIVGAGALQEGIATTNTTLISHGAFNVTGDPAHPAYVYDWADLGTLDFYHGLAMSSDIYFYCLAGGCPYLPGGGLAKGLGADEIARWAREFGLDTPTGIDLPNEAAGLIPDTNWAAKNLKNADGSPARWYVGDTYFMGIGQGYDTATPIQMVRVAAAIANGGDLLRPHIVREIDDANGNVVVPPQKQVVKHIDVSDQNLAIIRQGMQMAVEGGSAATAFVPGLHIAGKTGTAEFGAAIAKPTGDSENLNPLQNGKYNEHGWFISFAPYDNPQVALVVFHDNGGGAATAAPTAKKIWDYYFNQYKKGNPNPGASPTPAAPKPAGG